MVAQLTRRTSLRASIDEIASHDPALVTGASLSIGVRTLWRWEEPARDKSRKVHA
jgi:hypothetical protein